MAQKPQNSMSDPVFYSRGGLHVEIYDAVTSQGWGQLHDDVGFYLDEARIANGMILELACGTGRVTIPLVEAGHEVHSLDLSEPMLNVLNTKRNSLPEPSRGRLHLHAGDMSAFSLEERFALILLPFRSFQILPTAKLQRACLDCIRRHLAPDGRAILNLFDPRYDLLLPGTHAGSVTREISHPISGNRVTIEVLERTNDPITQTFCERWRFSEFASDGRLVRREIEELPLRWTFRQEMIHLLELSGLLVEAIYSDFQRNEPAYGKEQIFVVRRGPGP